MKTAFPGHAGSMRRLGPRRSDGKDTEGWGARSATWASTLIRQVVVYDGSSFKRPPASGGFCATGAWRTCGCSTATGRPGKTAGLPVETDKPHGRRGPNSPPSPRSERLATKGLLLASLKDKSLQIVDARSEGEFCGLEKLRNKRAGAIPGARHLEWIDLIDKETQRFKTPRATPQALREKPGIELDRPTATHCQRGGRASVMAFGMELMGAGKCANYYASWGEWGNADDTPIVVASPKRSTYLESRSTSSRNAASTT